MNVPRACPELAEGFAPVLWALTWAAEMPREGISRRTTTRRWAKQEKQLHLALANASGMHGDFPGLLGTSLQPIAVLNSKDADPAAQAGLALAAQAEDAVC
jgi:hypothetical protein